MPEPNWTDDLGLQFIVIVPPQKLKIGIVEERACVGGTLAAMDTASAELQPKVGQNVLRRIRILAADEYVIKA